MSKQKSKRSDNGSDPHAPTHKYVNGELVELTEDEIAEILQQRADYEREQEQTNERGGSERR